MEPSLKAAVEVLFREVCYGWQQIPDEEQPEVLRAVERVHQALYGAELTNADRERLGLVKE